MAKTMAVNAGSSSLKFQLLEMPAEQVIAQGVIERIGMDDAIVTIKYGAEIVAERLVGHSDDDEDHITITKDGKGKKYENVVPIKDHQQAINFMLQKLTDLGIIEDFQEITGVGHRVVAGGEWFNHSVVVTDEVLAKIDRLADYAPLHNPANAMGIRAFQKLLPDALSVAVFDTSFHQTMPDVNYLYSMPYEYYTRYGARKYGAHGTSHRYVSARAAAMLGKDLKDLKLITLHLGAGASITAIKDGKSFDTSMGFSPLAGVTMATRAGDVDPSLVYYIQEREGLTNDEMLNVLNKKSGLLGISTISSDMRDLLDVQDTNEHAKLAINIFINRVIKYVGQYVAEMNGVDAIVFTAGIGENSVPVRKMIVDKLSYFGIKLDNEKNNVRGEEVEISTSDSKVKALLIPTNEELMIARDVESLKG
ncbi:MULTISPECIES: acetate/propionate family kinase [Leuconostoc]|jgi:acetate kinase|uniref:Acetate kinase n=3 Tax=Leuconostoc pseudomesenteroides TaxID=33968 RepID=A0A5B8T457_LEUPS|nr:MULTISPECIES: acetate kinase [Leuconostoc]MBK0039573.1 acetate kinase [Leuconostoc sp. S51]MBK0050532.1 acetate kinase [Leuconostoc sp. S50]MBS0957370.1 acetate kinase [Leuconostoc pseudomesenteroides]MCC7668354.1 acetate kinase [Leuconostoc pseudomesenteroides]MCC8438795.1 acetate kinase [Leuconostoc pseudomesenteroides]